MATGLPWQNLKETSENPFELRSQIHESSKRGIARWAAGLVQDGDTILMDASTTVFNMVPFLVERRNLVILTNGIETGLRLAENSTNSVILMAGFLRRDGAAVVGPLYEPALRSRPIKTAFVSCQGFSLAAGLTDTDTNEAAVKNCMVTLADFTVALIELEQIWPGSSCPVCQSGSDHPHFQRLQPCA